MVKVIMGLKGTGKTKQMVELINAAASEENGNVVAIEHSRSLTFDIHYKIRLVDAITYQINSYESLRGFISGLYAGNYDITHIFIEGLRKILPDENQESTTRFLDWLEQFSQENGIKFTVSISVDPALAPEGIRKYF
ncbi:MAG: hypothetical protein LUF80_06220 [Oscillospiraceae bacterium]|nr:hypothetical protein [Oscillospiraceae bacterium]